MHFKNLGLIDPLVQAIREEGYTTPTSIQQQSIPLILSGVDCMACSQTGSGKTAGFTLPLLQRLATNSPHGQKRRVRALIMVPTRELAAQVAESVQTYGRHLPFKTAVIFGGVNINPQIKLLQQGVDLVVATPGRLLDLHSQKAIDLSQVEILVLDEADRMLDMGFIHDIRKIMALLPTPRQTLLFSATFSDEIKQLSRQFLKHPKLIESASRSTTADRIAQMVYPVDNKRKKELLSHLIKEGNWRQVLVFTRTKHGANKLTKQLEAEGITAAAIHGNKSQPARTRALADFKQGTIRVLVATDIAARGLDIDLLPHVVNFELPNIPEDYVHRIGRTGRAGQEGEAISLVCVDELDFLRSIERLIKTALPKTLLPGFEPDPSIKPEPILRGRQGGQNRGPTGGQNRGHGRRSGPPRSGKPAKA